MKKLPIIMIVVGMLLQAAPALYLLREEATGFRSNSGSVFYIVAMLGMLLAMAGAVIHDLRKE